MNKVFTDNQGYPSVPTGDVGDSAVRNSILTMCGVNTKSISDYEVKPGLWARHPNDPTWSNENNCTRDQLKMILGALKANGDYKAARRMFWSRARSFFFTQSIERDVRGSKKIFWPHSLYKDSNPVPTTYPKKFNWRKLKFESTIPVLEGYTIEEKIADGPDPLFPNHIGMMILAGRMYPLYAFLPLCYLFHVLFLYLHSKSKHFEENQFIAECYVYGTLSLYETMKPHWVDVNRKYWQDRGELVYIDLLEKFVKERVR